MIYGSDLLGRYVSKTRLEPNPQDKSFLGQFSFLETLILDNNIYMYRVEIPSSVNKIIKENYFLYLLFYEND